MNRSLSLHPLSLVLGIVFAGICFVSMSQTTAFTAWSIDVIAHPRDMVQIREGTPYIVPTGKTLTLTAIGTTTGGAAGDLVAIAVDGQQEAQTSAWRNTADEPSSVTQVASGRAVAAGSSVSVTTSFAGQSGRAWGYLGDAHPMHSSASKTLAVPYRPEPRDMVLITEGSQYTVPPGRIFVLTALGGTNAGAGAADHSLSVNGQVELSALDPGPFNVSPLARVADGFSVGAGSIVEVFHTAGVPSPTRAWGYLAAQ